MYGDSDTIRAMARRLRDQGDAVRRLGEALSRPAEHVVWSGRSADAMREVVALQCRGLRHTADLHDRAAAALERHADAVDRARALIAAVESAVHRMVDEARHRLADLAQTASGVLGAAAGALGLHPPDPLDLLLDRFDPPDPGSVEWLRVDLPVTLPLDLPDLPGPAGFAGAAA